MRMLLAAMMGLAWLVTGSAALRADDSDAAEELPMPREVAAEPILPGPLPEPILPGPLPNPMYFRTSHYAIWQFYGVDRQGRFRPRVIWGPHGAYYLDNGQPFPWVTTHPLEVLPYVTQPASGSLVPR